MVIKILIMGDDGVGKTTIINQYIGLKLSSTQSNGNQPNIGTKIVKSGGKEVKLQLWEVSTNFEETILLNTQVFSGADAVLMVFDVTNISTMNYIRRVRGKLLLLLNNIKIPAMLIGNKIDLRNEYEEGVDQISFNQGSEFSSELSNVDGVHIKMPYFECSAKDKDSYEKIFTFLINKMLGLFSEKPDK